MKTIKRTPNRTTITEKVTFARAKKRLKHNTKRIGGEPIQILPSSGRWVAISDNTYMKYSPKTRTLVTTYWHD